MKDILDHLYISAHSSFKNKSKGFKNKLALYYIIVFQLLFIFLLGLFFKTFSEQLHWEGLTVNQYLILVFFCVLTILFRSWMVYTGKRRLLLLSKAKKKYQPIGIFKLGFILLTIILLIIVLFQI